MRTDRSLGRDLACGFVTASAYWAVKRRPVSKRTVSDNELTAALPVRTANYRVYGVRTMEWLLHRQGQRVGRDRSRDWQRDR